MKYLLLSFIVLTAASAQTPKEYGSLAYPAPGNLHWDEGTVELWLVSDFDSDVETKDRSSWATLFDIKSPPDDRWHYVLTFLTWGHSLAQIGYATPNHSYVWAGLLHWKPGERHHVAWSWRGRQRNIVADGLFQWKGTEGPCVATNIVVEGWLHGELEQAQLLVGIGHSLLTIDELRISSIARPIEELQRNKDVAPVRDSYTLLLDHCDGGPAEVIAGLSGEKGGMLSGGYKIIDGQFGKAIQLWKN